MAQGAALDPGWKRRFFTIWVGQAFSLFGSQLVQFALIWWLTETTRSATVLATATLVGVLPQVLLGPFAGPLVDRWNRRKVMVVSDALVALATLVLVLLFASGTAQVWHVFAAMFIRSLAGSFHFPSMEASTSLMVPDDQLARVAGLNQMLFGLMGIVAPPAGALLLAALPMQGVLAVDIVTAVIAVLSLLLVSIPQPEHKVSAGSNPFATFWRDLRDGFSYIRAWPGLMAVIVVAMLLNLVVSPASSLTPLLVTNHFGGREGELAAMSSAMSVGMVIGGVTLGVWGGFKRRIYTSLVGVVGTSLGFVLVGAAPAGAFWMAVAAFFLSGVMMPITNGPMMAVMQSVVTPEMQGRVFTLLNSGSMLMMPLGLAVAGPLADRLGVQSMYLIAGGLCLLLTVVALGIPPLMNIERNHTGAVETVSASAD